MENPGKQPTENDIIPNHVGALGEALFNTRYAPPDPIPDVIHAFVGDQAPDWVEIEDTHIQIVQKDTSFVVNRVREEYRWVSDAEVTARYRIDRFEDEQRYNDIL